MNRSLILLLFLVPACSDPAASDGPAQEGYCVGTAGDACEDDAECPVTTRCIPQGFCAVVCTSTAQCDGARCFGVDDDVVVPGNNGANNGDNNGANNGDNNGDNNGGPNQAPNAQDDQAATIAGMIVEIPVVDNDIDPDGDDLEVKEFTQGERGAVSSGRKGALDYLPNDSEWTGTDTFTYVVHDGNGGEDTASVTVRVNEQPILRITSPESGAVVAPDRVTIEFEVNGCNFTFPSNDSSGCHGHKWLDGGTWSDENGDNFGQYDTGSFDIYPLAEGEHTFELRLVVNDGSDQDWSPAVNAAVTFTVMEPEPEFPDPAPFDGDIARIAYTGLGGSLLLATSAGLHSWSPGETEVAQVFANGDFTALAQNPFSGDVYWASGVREDLEIAQWGFAASQDAGASWTEVSRTNENVFTLMAASREQRGLVAALSGNQIFVSGDAGANWDWYTWPNAVAGMEIVDAEGPVILIASGGIQRITYPEGGFETVLLGAYTGVDWHPSGVILAGPDAAFSVCDKALAECTDGEGPQGASVVQYLAAADSNVLYALDDAGNVHRSDDRGDGWYVAIQRQ